MICNNNTHTSSSYNLADSQITPANFDLSMLLDNSRVLSNLNTRVSSNIVSVITWVGSSSTSVQIFLKDADLNNSLGCQVAIQNTLS